jgi:hypothetical protein
VAEWGTTWLGYSRYDGVVLTADELRRAPAPVQAALVRSVEGGGALLVLGPWEPPDTWKRVVKTDQGFTVYRPAFGVCLVSGDADTQHWSRARWDLVADAWSQTASSGSQRQTEVEANRIFPVVENVAVPVRGLFLIMVLFAVAIGPVNLTLLSLYRRRIWLLWTAPAVSLVTCATVFGYMLVAEGWEGHLRTAGLTVLDEPARRATSLGWTAFYSPLTPSGGLHFDGDTEVALQGTRGEAQRGAACALDWTNDQHLASGWVAARVPSHFLLRKSEVRRERVTFSRAPDGGLAIVNGLGADLDQFWYADEKGKVYEARNVPAGSQAALTPVAGNKPQASPPGGEFLRMVLASGWAGNANNLVDQPERFLYHRGYVAVLGNAAPFFEDGLRGAKTRRYRSVVVGIPREAGDEG